MLAPHSADTAPTRHNLREPTRHRHDVRQADMVQCCQHGLCRVGDMAPTCRHVCRFGGKKSPTRRRHFQQRKSAPRSKKVFPGAKKSAQLEYGTLHLEDTGLGGNGGEYIAPPPKKVDKEEILSHMFSEIYFSKFILNSYVKTVFA